jgi:hypothetical protein
MSTSFVLLSGVRPGRYYNLIEFRHGVRMTDIQLGKTDNKNIVSTTKLGKLAEIRQYGRYYDPEIRLCFEREDGHIYEFEPKFGSSEAFVEYEEDSEETSKVRTIERTLSMKIEIEGNDWALRPENVVATQGLEVGHFAP